MEPPCNKGCCNNLLADLIQTDIPDYQNFLRMPLQSLSSFKNAYTTASRRKSPILGSPYKLDSNGQLHWDTPQQEKYTNHYTIICWLGEPIFVKCSYFLQGYPCSVPGRAFDLPYYSGRFETDYSFTDLFVLACMWWGRAWCNVFVHGFFSTQ